MGCFGDKEKGEVSEQRKWAYINLDDFKSTSCLTPLSYAWLWFLSGITVSAYVADTFTAVNLLAFNKWTGDLDPPIAFDIVKWIFAGCIILSWVLAGFEFLRAFRVMRGGGVAESYLDPLAVVLQSMRVGRLGRGWRRFLVFAELTKSKKGTDYIALFVYFQFKAAIRIVLAEGPRQVVNALTLYGVLQANLIPEGANEATDGRSGVQQFFYNIEVLAESNKEQAVTLCTMLYTLILWVISALSLLLSIILYLLFLWHYIPSTDGTLSRYCRRKVDSRLDRIISKKTKAALEEENKKRMKEQEKALKTMKKKGNADVDAKEVLRKPTLPVLAADDDNSSIYSGTTLRGPTRTNTSETLDGSRPPMPSRTGTGASSRSNAPLLGDAGSMGYSDPVRTQSPAPQLPPLDRRYFDNRAPSAPPARMRTNPRERPFSSMDRPGTAQSLRSASGPGGMPGGPRRPPYGPPPRSNTGFNEGPGGPYGPLPRSNTGFNEGQGGPYGPPPRSNTGFSQGSSAPYGPPMRSNTGFDAANIEPYRPPVRSNTGLSNGPGGPGPRMASPAPSLNGPLDRRPTGPSPLSASPPQIPPFSTRSPSPPMQFGQSFEMSPVDRSTASPLADLVDDYGTQTPMPLSAPQQAAPPPPPQPQPQPQNTGGYVAFNPRVHTPGSQQQQQQAQQQHPDRTNSPAYSLMSASSVAYPSTSTTTQPPSSTGAWHSGPGPQGMGPPMRSATAPVDMAAAMRGPADEPAVAAAAAGGVVRSASVAPVVAARGSGGLDGHGGVDADDGMVSDGFGGMVERW